MSEHLTEQSGILKLLDKELFEILSCPVCKGDLSYVNDSRGLYCSVCDHVYDIKQGIPILLPPTDNITT